MKKFWLVIAVMVFALAPISAPAATLSIDATHVMNATVQNTTTSAYLTPVSGTIGSYVTGYGWYASESNSDSENVYIAPSTPNAVSVSATTPTWVVSNQGDNNYNGATQFTMTHDMEGNAANPSSLGANDGYLYQYVRTEFTLTYTAGAGEAGLYIAKVQDLYDLVYALVNTSGGSNWFSSTDGNSYLVIVQAASPSKVATGKRAGAS